MLYENFVVHSIAFLAAPIALTFGLKASSGTIRHTPSEEQEGDEAPYDPTCAIVVSIGETQSYIAAVWKGKEILPSKSSHYTGELLNTILRKKIVTTRRIDDIFISRIKAGVCSVFPVHLDKTQGTSGKYINFSLCAQNYRMLEDDAMLVMEEMFDPNCSGDELPIQYSIYEMMKFAAYALTRPGEKDVRHRMIRVLLKNVIISGGNTQFPGFDQRLETELKELAQQRLKRNDIVAVVRGLENRISDLVELGSLALLTNQFELQNNHLVIAP